MPGFAERPKASQQAGSPKALATAQPHSVGTEEADSILRRLSRTIGNQATERSLGTIGEESKNGPTAGMSAHFGYDFARIPLHPPNAVATQQKLSVNNSGEECEKEADSAAEQVMRMPEPRLRHATPGYRKEWPSRQREKLLIQRVPALDEGQTTAPSVVNQVLGASGRSLDEATRTFMESRLSHDFSQVQVHTDDRAAESSQSVDAAAYTVGKHVVFGAGQYRPETPGGRALLAHELAHVKQQSISKPLLQRAPIPGPNFTPSDFANLQGVGKDLTIAADSSWFPSKLQDNLLNTLRFLLGPKISPRGTEGVNVLDFFHGHLVVDRKDLLVDWEGKQRPPEQAMKHAEQFEKQEKLAAARTLGGTVTDTRFGPNLSFHGRYPVTARNLPAFTTAIEKLLPAFGNVLDEGSKVPGAAVMYHTFELTTPSDLAAQGQKLNHENPRRHYVTPLNTNIPRQYTPPAGGYETEYVVLAPFSFLVDTNGAVHVRPFAASAGSTFTSLELSTVTGTPFPGEPFPVP